MMGGASGTAGTGAAYLEQLTGADLALLAEVTGTLGGPETIEALVAHPAAFEAVFAPAEQPILRASPFLTFAVAVHRAAADLRSAPFVPEWVGPRQRLPLFETRDLAAFLDDRWRRFFVTELLASYTHVASGAMWVQTRRGWRRRRFSELDPVRLASLLEVMPEAERPGIYRRLGDLALFLTGVFPDHTAASPLGPLEHARLLHSARLPAAGALEPAEAAPSAAGGGGLGAVGVLEALGERWYELACAGAPSPLVGTMRVVSEVTGRFRVARRVLNYLTDRHLFPFVGDWFAAPA